MSKITIRVIELKGTWILIGGLEHFLFLHISGIIIPTDYFFCRGVETTNQDFIWFYPISCQLWVFFVIFFRFWTSRFELVESRNSPRNYLSRLFAPQNGGWPATLAKLVTHRFMMLNESVWSGWEVGLLTNGETIKLISNLEIYGHTMHH